MRISGLLLCWSLLGSAGAFASSSDRPDWLMDSRPYISQAWRSPDQRQLVLENGLVGRTFRLDPNVATVTLNHIVTGEELLRSVRPEASVELDGVRYNLGGLLGQPVHNFLKLNWVDAMHSDPLAWNCVDVQTGKTQPRFPWKPRREWMSTDSAWPAPGVRVTFEYAPSAQALELAMAGTNEQREILFEDSFATLSNKWKVHASGASPRSSFQTAGTPGAITGLENTAVFAEAPLPPGVRMVECVIEPGTDRSASWGPGMTVLWPNRTTKFYLRPGKGTFGVTDNGSETEHAGLDPATAWHLRMHLLPTSLRCDVSTNGREWKTIRVIELNQPLVSPVAVRVGKTSRSGGTDSYSELGSLGQCRIKQFRALGKVLPDPNAARPALEDVRVRVHYELYDGLPLFAKWLSVHNNSTKPVTLNSFTVEQLAVVEPESIGDGTAANFRSEFRSLQVFSDFSFGGNMSGNADAPAVRWKTDPLYHTQVHYERQTPCLLECAPPIGPETIIAPGGTFESFYAFELVHDSTERERRGMAVRRAYRTLAPWVQENPILMHVRSARPEAVKAAVDQCAKVGFEMVIMTFGSGFNIEDKRPEYLKQVKDLADYARSKGIVLGGYSLLASRSINAANDVLCPGGPRFGSSPCLGSRWGRDYFQKLYSFFENTGCAILEHDGSYPGDMCASTNHPGHTGLRDSQWKQWKMISDFYQWCRARGIYLNVPDWYYLAGSSKCGMGYRETNWSLPRDQQEIIERQNIFDGTWEKTPSMGWMFVPLTEYHGGGAAATIEPLQDHLDHYETRLANLFGAGVQACYRGPRLFDSEKTEGVVRKWVQFYKQHRAILDSDIIHLHRPDGRDWDGILHVNPKLPERGLAMFYNPLAEEIVRKMQLPLYYTGLADKAVITHESGAAETVSLARDYSATVTVRISARSRTWLLVTSPGKE